MRRLALNVLLVAAIAAAVSLAIALWRGIRAIPDLGAALAWGGLITIAIGTLGVAGNSAQRGFTIQFAATTSDTPGATRGHRIVEDALTAYSFALTCFLAGAIVLAVGIALHRSVL